MPLSVSPLPDHLHSFPFNGLHHCRPCSNTALASLYPFTLSLSLALSIGFSSVCFHLHGLLSAIMGLSNFFGVSFHVFHKHKDTKREREGKYMRVFFFVLFFFFFLFSIQYPHTKITKKKKNLCAKEPKT